MADRYISHLGSNTSPYNSWATAATTINTAITGAVSTDNFWLASDHVQTSATSITATLNTSPASVTPYISVNRAGSTPPVAADIVTGAAISTTGTGGITVNGTGYMKGVNLNTGNNTGSTNLTCGSTTSCITFEDCTLNLSSSQTNSGTILGGNGGIIRLINTSVSFNNVLQGIYNNGRLYWRNNTGITPVTGSIPTVLVLSGTGGYAEYYGLDLTAFSTGKTLVASSVVTKIMFINCKLDAAVTITGTQSNRNAAGIFIIGCNSGGIVERNEIYRYMGILTTETTIVRTAGATDGTTPYSWKIVSTANNDRADPFDSFEGAIWNSITGTAKTLTVHCVTDNISLTDAEIWLEVEYLGSATAPISYFIDDASATVLTAGTAQTTSTEAWTTTGLTTPLKQKLEVTFTPQMVGPIRWRVRYAKDSTTVYVDPKAELS